MVRNTVQFQRFADSLRHEYGNRGNQVFKTGSQFTSLPGWRFVIWTVAIDETACGQEISLSCRIAWESMFQPSQVDLRSRGVTTHGQAATGEGILDVEKENGPYDRHIRFVLFLLIKCLHRVPDNKGLIVDGTGQRVDQG